MDKRDWTAHTKRKAQAWTMRVYSQDEVAEMWGVSRTLVYAIEKSSLDKLREALCLDGTAYDYLIDRRPPAPEASGPGIL